VLGNRSALAAEQLPFHFFRNLLSRAEKDAKTWSSSVFPPVHGTAPQ